ncbi:hypothetical protein Ae406Ps2_2417 [Pseudonocardia sp. Ae406_Ps2]|nr:hypothetical protein Ae331Ps2_3500c [Pseudonocardia sp. Ae331_Ps2]OLM02417.1 hypothetical protein Ae406Ps2_2417 [Pseudonocardia sp. Ae406_Ps2]OLM23988.1 hypothetical protein Ae706Ps2_2421 [Pseudonocardia sp. Ae706_Ps2]
MTGVAPAGGVPAGTGRAAPTTTPVVRPRTSPAPEEDL